MLREQRIASMAEATAIRPLPVILKAIFFCSFKCLPWWCDFVYQTESKGRLCAEHPAGKDDLKGFGHSYEAGESLRAPCAGHETQLDLGKSESSVFCSNAHVTCQCQLKASSEAQTVYGSQHRLFVPFYYIKEPLRVSDDCFGLPCRPGLRQFPEFGTGGKNVAASRKDNCLGSSGSVAVLEMDVQFLKGVSVQAVGRRVFDVNN